MRRNRFYDEVILMKFLRIAAAGLVLAWVGAAFAACPVTSLSVKDGTGTSQTLCYGGASGAFINSTAVTDASGNIVGTTTNGVAGLNVSDNKLQVVLSSDGLTNPTVPDLLGFMFGYNGSSWDRLRDDANFFLNVDLGATTDTRPAVQNISAVDSASTTTAGQNGINQITGTPSAQSAAAQAIQGQATAIVQITGTGNGTIVFEGANDGVGTTWFPIRAHQRGSDNYIYSITGSALNGTYEIPSSGLSNVRVRATTWTSGASAPKWSFAQAAGNVQVVNKGAWTPKLGNALSTTVLGIKSTTGQLGVVQCYNPNSSQVYVQLFNVASGSVTLGTTTPLLSIPIAPTNTGGFALAFPGGFQFNGGMSAAVTAGPANSTAPSTAADCNFGFN